MLGSTILRAVFESSEYISFMVLGYLLKSKFGLCQLYSFWMHYPLRLGHLFNSATKRKKVDIVFVFVFSIIIV